jgi:hypothetical protein
MFDNDEFEESNFTDEVLMKAIREERVRMSMEYAWSKIEETAIDVWVRSLPLDSDGKRTHLKNLIEFFQEREEYEKCAVIQKGFRFCDLWLG